MIRVIDSSAEVRRPRDGESAARTTHSSTARDRTTTDTEVDEDLSGGISRAVEKQSMWKIILVYKGNTLRPVWLSRNTF